MNIFDPTKSIIENINYLSGPILAILGFAAIIQLRLTKKALIITSKRQAAELATQQIGLYTSQIIPLQNKFTEIKIAKNIPRIICQDLERFTIEELKLKTKAEIIQSKSEQLLQHSDDILPILNAMDSFSIYFTKGVADEEIAFTSIGHTFCFTVDSFSYDLCLLRKDDDENCFNNLVKLYEIWNSRIKAEKINRELLKKKHELQKIKVDKVNILGTK